MRRRAPSRRQLAIASALVLAGMFLLGCLCVHRLSGSLVATRGAGDASESESLDVDAALPRETIDAVEQVAGSELSELVSQDVTRTRVSLPPVEAAIEILKRYEAARDCLLVRADYLDLYGQVWSCVVQGGDWVEIQVVRAGEDGRESEVSTIRMDAKAWEKGLSQLGEEGL